MQSLVKTPTLDAMVPFIVNVPYVLQLTISVSYNFGI
jgi:hypothetical protein